MGNKMTSWLVDPAKYFKRFDADKNGKLSADELVPALRSLGFNPKKDDIDRIMAAADKNDDGFIEYDDEEFRQFLECQPATIQELKMIVSDFISNMEPDYLRKIARQTKRLSEFCVSQNRGHFE